MLQTLDSPENIPRAPNRLFQYLTMLTFLGEFACTLFFSSHYSLDFIAQPVRADPVAHHIGPFNANSLWPLIFFPVLLTDGTGIRILKINTVPFLFERYFRRIILLSKEIVSRNACAVDSIHTWGKCKELSSSFLPLVAFVVTSENKDVSSVL